MAAGSFILEKKYPVALAGQPFDPSQGVPSLFRRTTDIRIGYDRGTTSFSQVGPFDERHVSVPVGL